jgi:hypothetical protein
VNQRIKELLCQAYDQAVPETWTTLSSEQLERVYEKFALLIVQECLNQCYYRGMNDELYAGQLKAAAYIEQHFGVEE